MSSNSNEDTQDQASKNDSPGKTFSIDDLAAALERLSVRYPVKLPEENKIEHVLSEPNLDNLAESIRSGKLKNIVILAGAGISVSAGIPDFRSPGTGLYDNLQKYNLPHPMAVFDINFFQNNPKPFNTLVRELMPEAYHPTPTHYFFKLLEQKKLLSGIVTQNIDGLEFKAGITPDLIHQAHGGMSKAACVKCSAEYPLEQWRSEIHANSNPTCTKCDGYIKPNIVFFGESLDVNLLRHVRKLIPEADALFVMGTSMQVQPVAGLLYLANQKCVRVLVNREPVALEHDLDAWDEDPTYSSGFRFHKTTNKRDIFLQGDCDSRVFDLVSKLGWIDEYTELLKDHPTALDNWKSYLSTETTSNSNKNKEDETQE